MTSKLNGNLGFPGQFSHAPARDLPQPFNMRTQRSTTVVGVFEDRLHANQAITELHQAGFTRSQIGVVMRHAEGGDDAAAAPEHRTHAAAGALTGALTGLGLGALAGLGVLAGVIPVIGPAIAAGTLGVVLSNAAAGAGIAGFLGALVGAGIQEHQAKFYQGELEVGRSIITVKATGRTDKATTILRRCGGCDLSSRRAAMPST
jgi:hypothetical protein